MKATRLLPKDGPRPLVLVIMDGIAYSSNPVGNAVADAYTPHLDWLLTHCPYTLLKAHGTAVGLPSDADMGNSEVGHNAIGAGRVYAQGARLVNEALATGRLFQGRTWRRLIEFCRQTAGRSISSGSFPTATCTATWII